MNEPNVVNREVILEQVADKGLFVICIRSVHLFTESFVSVFYLIIRDYSSSCQLLVPVPPEYWTFKMASLCYFLVLSHGLALFAVPRCYSDSISNFLIFPLPADHSWQRNREQKSRRGLKTNKKGSAYFQEKGWYLLVPMANVSFLISFFSNEPKWLLVFW